LHLESGAERAQPVRERHEQEHRHRRRQRGAAPAGHRGAADDRRGDHEHERAIASDGLAELRLSANNAPAAAESAPGRDEGERQRTRRVHPGVPRGAAVAADEQQRPPRDGESEERLDRQHAPERNEHAGGRSEERSSQSATVKSSSERVPPSLAMFTRPAPP
jgi:hypothetical protein